MDGITPKSHLDWEYKPQTQPREESWFKTFVRDIFIFILYIIVGYIVVFLPTLFYVGDFLDPVPSTLEAIKVSGIILGGVTIFSSFAFWKGKSVTASALLIGGILAISTFGAGYFYYLNDQTLPLFERILSLFSL